MKRQKKSEIATSFDDPALIRAVLDKQGKIVAYGRTRIGQAVYDIFCSSMSAAEAGRRHKLSRDTVLRMRHEHPELRKKK